MTREEVLAEIRCAKQEKRRADLQGVDLQGVDLRGADLWSADLEGAKLQDAPLQGVDLRGADFKGANLHGVSGLPAEREFLEKLEKDELGWIVYKRIGAGKTQYLPPKQWVITPGEVLTEECNTDRREDCAPGVNFGTRDWCKNRYSGADLWCCRIRFIWKDDVVVPYATDGKARCSRLELLERIG